MTDNDELVFYNEETDEEYGSSEEFGEEVADEFGDSFVNRPFLRKWLADDTDDTNFLEKLRQQKIADRKNRRKTNKITGNFLLDVLVMLTFSPDRFFAGWEIFSNFYHLGERTAKKTNRNAGLLYKRKKFAFWAGILSLSFIVPLVGELIGLFLGIFGLKYGIRSLGKGAFFGKTWAIIVVIVAFEVAWNFFKSILKSILGVMEEAYNTVMRTKAEVEKTKKAQAAKKAAEEKAKEKEAAQNGKKDPPPKAAPIRPSGRGHFRQSGG